jgi:hypothetical protein
MNPEPPVTNAVLTEAQRTRPGPCMNRGASRPFDKLSAIWIA